MKVRSESALVQRGTISRLIISRSCSLSTISMFDDNCLYRTRTAACTLVRYGQLCLAIVEVVAFQKAGAGTTKSRLSSISVDDLDEAGNKVDVLAQVLDMAPYQT